MNPIAVYIPLMVVALCVGITTIKEGLRRSKKLNFDTGLGAFLTGGSCVGSGLLLWLLLRGGGGLKGH